MAKQILIGTMVRGEALPEITAYINNLGKYGFESIEITFGGDAMWVEDMAEYAKAVRECAEKNGMIISALGVYGNPLIPEGEQTRLSLEKVIDNAEYFGAKVIAGFTGRLIDQPMPESLPRFAEVFAPLAARAADKGLKIAFENCPMGGNWKWGNYNIAVKYTQITHTFAIDPQGKKLMDLSQFRQLSGHHNSAFGNSGTVRRHTCIDSAQKRNGKNKRHMRTRRSLGAVAQRNAPRF